MDCVWQEQARIQLRSKTAARLKAAKAGYDKLTLQQIKLRQEVLKSLTGESVFDSQMLKEMLEENKRARAAAE